MDFPLSNTVFAKAKVPPAKHVNLWLGANVMLEYDLEEADSLLVSQSRVHAAGYGTHTLKSVLVALLIQYDLGLPGLYRPACLVHKSCMWDAAYSWLLGDEQTASAGRVSWTRHCPSRALLHAVQHLTRGASDLGAEFQCFLGWQL